MNQHEMAIEELARGQECATKLQELLLVVHSCKTHDQLGRDFKDGSQSFMDLTEGMLKSFTNTLSILNFGDLNLDHDQEVSQVIQGGGASADGSRSEESDQESSKLKVDPKSRVAYKRRKNTDSRYIDSPICNFDGHAWRKYGQKEILKSKYPRNYFRCTHKNEQGCQATKQVQRIQEDPPLYRTTYFGQHSCRNLEKDAQLIFDDLFAEEGNAKLLSFSNNNTNTKDSPPFSSFASGKCEFSELEPPSDHLTQNQSSSANYYYVPSQMPEIFDHGLVHNPAENFSLKQLILLTVY